MPEPGSEFHVAAVSPPAHPRAVLADYVPPLAQKVLELSGDPDLCAAIKARTAAHITSITSEPEATAPNKGWCDEILHAPTGELDLPFPDGHFDCIACDNVLPKVRDAEPIMREISRLLAPGGTALFTAPNLQHFDHVLMLAGGEWALADAGALARDHLRFFTALELVALARRAGLEAKRCGVLVTDAPEVWPLDEAHCYRRGRVVIGPLSTDEYKRFLAREYLLIAQKP